MTQQAGPSHMLCSVAAYVYPQHPFDSACCRVYGNTSCDKCQADLLVGRVCCRAQAGSCCCLAMATTRNICHELEASPCPAASPRLWCPGSRIEGGGGVATHRFLCFDKACALNGKRPGEFVVLRSVLEQLLPESADPTLLDALPAHLLQMSYSACCQVWAWRDSGPC
jgi:hypothetical protein